MIKPGLIFKEIEPYFDSPGAIIMEIDFIADKKKVYEVKLTLQESDMKKLKEMKKALSLHRILKSFQKIIAG